MYSANSKFCNCQEAPVCCWNSFHCVHCGRRSIIFVRVLAQKERLKAKVLLKWSEVSYITSKKWGNSVWVWSNGQHSRFTKHDTPSNVHTKVLNSYQGDAQVPGNIYHFYCFQLWVVLDHRIREAWITKRYDSLSALTRAFNLYTQSKLFLIWRGSKWALLAPIRIPLKRENSKFSKLLVIQQ